MNTLYQKLYETKAKRLQLQQMVNVLEQEEKDILYQITKEVVPAEAWDFISGDYRVITTFKVVPNITAWPELLGYIKHTGSLDLLQKRLTESAVKARWDADIEVPGVSKTTKYIVNITKETP